MDLTDKTFNLFAAKYYDNPYCFNEDEFHSDLKRIGTIKRMISWINNGDDINIHLLINNVILFYNVFEPHAASKMLEHKMDNSHYPKMNSILYYLSLPMISDETYDIVFHRKIAQTLKDL